MGIWAQAITIVPQLSGYIDVSHTSHTTSNTGIQRVTRCMTRAIGELVESVSPVTFDPFQDAWRELNDKERECLFPKDFARPGSRRRPRWTTRQRIFGVSQRPILGPKRQFLKGETPFDFVLFPEIISEEIGNQFPVIRPAAGSLGPRIGVFHDAIAWKFPEWSAKKTADRYPGYMQSLLNLDGIAAVSEASKSDLLEFWNSIGVPEKKRPRVEVLYLGTEPLAKKSKLRAVSDIPVVLCVATLEARKNHIGLLAAVAYLWHLGYRFKLELVGGSNRETGVEAVAAIERFRESGLPVTWHGAVSDGEVEAAYERADFVVYPSLYEGFGLPVIEATQWGKPMLTTFCGSLKEVVQGGGCHVLDSPSASSIAQGMRELLDHPDYFARLQVEALARPVRTWKDYASDMVSFVEDMRNAAS